jgi:hypothetical protein
MPSDRKFTTRGSHRPAHWRSVTLGFLGLLGFGCGGLAIVFCGCGIPMVTVGMPIAVVAKKVEEGIEHHKGPIPESEWNKLGLWYRISDQPPTYLPKGFGRNQARNDQTGTWFLDARDGKRFFVPHAGANGLSSAIWAAEARKATEWRTPPLPKVTPGLLISGKSEEP